MSNKPRAEALPPPGGFSILAKKLSVKLVKPPLSLTAAVCFAIWGSYLRMMFFNSSISCCLRTQG